MRSILVLFSILLICFAATDAQSTRRFSGFGHQVEGPLLLAHKSLLDAEAVVDSPLTIQVSIFNVGDSAAYDIQLSDNQWIQDNAQVLSTPTHGTVHAAWPILLPGQNVTHIYLVSPLKGGAVNLEDTAAVVYYSNTGTAETHTRTLSTEVQGYFSVLYASETERKAKPHMLEWLIFVGISIASLSLPYFQWTKSRSLFYKTYKK